MHDSSAGDLIGIVVISIALILFRRTLARAAFAMLAFLNDPHARGKRWRREHAVLQPFLAWFFAAAGLMFILYALLDAVGLISLA
jgi:hypothetical protein